MMIFRQEEEVKVNGEEEEAEVTDIAMEAGPNIIINSNLKPQDY